MGKPTGFLEYERKESVGEAPLKRIKHFNEFHTPLSKKEQERQGARCMNCGVPFCQSGILIKGMVTGCPLNNLIPEWNDATYTGNWDEAYNRLRKTNPFPEFTGRVCPHPCEVGCTCNLGGDPVNIKEKELSIIERAYESGLINPEPAEVRTGKTVAIVGSGPSGLCVAEYLNRRGHSVTVYERSDRVGGLLMYGIPNMKLEKRLCHGAPFYVLGPLVTDIAPGYDHITSAIGGAIAASSGADFLCYVTPAEHLRLPTVEDVKEGIIAARIAAHAADLVKGIPGAQEWDDAMSKARVEVDFDTMIALSIDPEKSRRYYESSKPECEGTCTMCGKMCPARTMKRILAGEDVSIR